MPDNEDVPGNADETATPAETTQAHSAQPAATSREPVLKTRWRDRAWTFRSMLAVALASLVIGGVAGGVIGVAADHADRHDRHDRMERMGRMGPWGPGHGPGRGRGGGFQDGGPGWRGNAPQPPGMTPYGVPTPADPSNPTTPAPSPGSTG